MSKIINPIIRGFNPDPSIIRVEDDYFIATSTFEWFPGVQIHHSRDLANWKLISRALNRKSQLDLTGVDDSLGIWAPCLSYDNGIYYLVYTVVKSIRSGYMDAHNYLVTTEDIRADWSEPIYLNSIGFDPSLFHDDDGRKWFVAASCDNAPGHGWFGGIVLQEYLVGNKKLSGPMKTIFNGTNIGYVEGPHLYKKDGWYYLITAEGGTGLGHAVTLARSRSIEGPYEVGPQNPVLTSKYSPLSPLQKAGHADIVEAQTGKWYMVHLCGRPLPRKGKCILGRETAIQEVEWTDDGWLRLLDGNNAPDVVVDSALPLACEVAITSKKRYNFDTDELPVDFQSIRIPLDNDTFSLTERKGYLRLKGKESLCSTYHQALVARRQQAFCYTAHTCLEFEPESFKHMAGLVCFYNTKNYHYLYISKNQRGKYIGVITNNDGKLKFPLKNEIPIDDIKQCYFKVEVRYDILSFYYAERPGKWDVVIENLDASILSDENCKSGLGFTGAFVGVCCQDLLSGRKTADFKYIEYEEDI